MNHKKLFIVPLILSFFLTGCLAPQVEDNTNTNNTNTQQNSNNDQNNGETNNNDTNGSETGNNSGNTGNDNGTTGNSDDNGQDNTGGDNNQGNTSGNSGNTNEGDQNGTGNDSGNTGNENTGENNNQGGTGNESGNNGGDTGNAGGDSGNTGTGGDSDNTNTGGDSGNTNTSGDTGTNVATEGDGTEAHPYTISQAYDIIDALQEGKNNGKVVYVTGTVTTSVEDIYHGKYGSSFYITDGTKTIYAYSIAGVSKTEGNSKYVADGYTVVVSGALIKYNATKYEVGYASNSLPSSLVSSIPGSGTSSSSGGSSSSSGGSSSSGTSTQTPKEKVAWTIMIYMCGSSLESDTNGGLATDDISEILSVPNQPNDVNIIIETGGASRWYNTHGIKANELGRWHVENKKLVKDGSVANASMGKQATFESFLTWGLTYYPADRVGVIMWNHGGALDGCCFDENYDDNPLTNAEVNAALTNVKQSLNRTENFEFIAYDACLMAVQDIAEFNSHHFNYMLCSQESESGYGYDYDKWVDDLYANPTTITTEALLTEAGQTFLDEEKALYQEWNEPFDQTQSVYDLSKMAVYKTAYEAVATELAKTIDTKDKWNSFVTANIDTNNVQKYGADENGNYLYDIFDAEDVLNNIKNSYSSLSTKVDAAVAALEAVVVWEAHGEATSGCGMNIYCPINYKYYEEDTNFANWYSLCKLSGLYKDN